MARCDFGLAFVMSVCALATASLAQSPAALDLDASRIVATLPVEVVEIASGGSWISGQSSGTYRTVTLLISQPEEVSQVYLQWIGSRTPAAPLQIIASVPLREFNMLKLSSASIVLDAEIEGQAKITITGPDAETGPPQTVVFLATDPGLYQPLSVPPPLAPAANSR
jgi:hypothetical protein